MRQGSVVLWLFVLGLVLFILFTTFQKGMLQPLKFEVSPATESAIQIPMPSGSSGSVSTAPVPPLAVDSKDLSPYYKKIRIGSVVVPNDYDYQHGGGQLSLYADSSLSEPVDVTGWSVRGNRGNAVSVQKAVADYNPYTYAAPQSENVILSPGGTVYIYGWKSVLNMNLRPNKCTGYLNQQYAIYPQLPNECPMPDISRITLLTGACQNFVRSMYTCTTPKPDDLNRVSGQVEAECRAIIDKQNIVSCYNEHHNDANFYSKEWRTWVNEAFQFDRSHDRLILRDAKGLVVDDYTY